jgi:hypothetical protein
VILAAIAVTMSLESTPEDRRAIVHSGRDN